MRTLSFGSILFLLVCLGGCGNQGPPIPPEDVGIRAKVLRAQQEKAKQAQPVKPAEPVLPATAEPEETAPQDDVLLPPYRPVGTR